MRTSKSGKGRPSCFSDQDLLHVIPSLASETKWLDRQADASQDQGEETDSSRATQTSHWTYLLCVDPSFTRRRLWYFKCDVFAKMFLELADGTRSVNDIVVEALSRLRGFPEDKLRNRCIQLFRLLFEKGAVEDLGTSDLHPV